MKMIAVSSGANRAVEYDGHTLGVQFHPNSTTKRGIAMRELIAEEVINR